MNDVGMSETQTKASYNPAPTTSERAAVVDEWYEALPPAEKFWVSEAIMNAQGTLPYVGVKGAKELVLAFLMLWQERQKRAKRRPK